MSSIIPGRTDLLEMSQNLCHADVQMNILACSRYIQSRRNGQKHSKVIREHKLLCGDSFQTDLKGTHL